MERWPGHLAPPVPCRRAPTRCAVARGGRHAQPDERPLSLRGGSGRGDAARAEQPAAAESHARHDRAAAWPVPDGLRADRPPIVRSGAAFGPLPDRCRRRARAIRSAAHQPRSAGRAGADLGFDRRPGAARQALGPADPERAVRSAAPRPLHGPQQPSRCHLAGHRAGAAHVRLRVDGAARSAGRRRHRDRPAVLPGRHRRGARERATPAHAGDHAVPPQVIARFGRRTAAHRPHAVCHGTVVAAARRAGRGSAVGTAGRDLRLHRDRPGRDAPHHPGRRVAGLRRPLHHRRRRLGRGAGRARAASHHTGRCARRRQPDELSPARPLQRPDQYRRQAQLARAFELPPQHHRRRARRRVLAAVR